MPSRVAGLPHGASIKRLEDFGVSTDGTAVAVEGTGVAGGSVFPQPASRRSIIAAIAV
jgi:hypothetical protein